MKNAPLKLRLMFNLSTLALLASIALYGIKSSAADMLAQSPIPEVAGIAEKLQGKSVDYLLLCVTLAAIGCLAYTVREFVRFVIKAKEDQRATDLEHIKSLSEVHSATRKDLADSINAINNLADEIRARK